MNQQLFLLFLLLPLLGFSAVPAALARRPTFSVLDYGAKADGVHDDTQAFTDAWNAACAARGSVTLYVPPHRNYLVGPLKFRGPCRDALSITVQMEGVLRADTNLNRYVEGDDWIEFAWLNRLTLTGGGTFDGQGAVSWPYNKCPLRKDCKVLPTSIKFVYTNNTMVQGITSLNSKFFHMALIGCINFWGSNLKIKAPSDSPNTDGIHLERNTGVRISGSHIGSGDDCISIGHSNEDVLITGVKCGPGHGISIGSLGRYDYEGDVRGLVVKDCTFTQTSNGVRIKTWEDSPKASTAANMSFDNLVMYDVANPIIIDQAYCPYSYCSNQVPSRVRISDVVFSNIRGTSTTPVAVTLKCSSGTPCRNVNLNNVQLKDAKGGELGSECSNIKAQYSGTQMPSPCA